jgi:hypothetical protein
MKMPSRTPSTSALKLDMWNGLSHSRLTPGAVGTSVTATLISATTANSASVRISAVSSHLCVVALSSMPITQIQVMTAIQTTPTSVTAQLVSAADCQPKSRNE